MNILENKLYIIFYYKIIKHSRASRKWQLVVYNVRG